VVPFLQVISDPARIHASPILSEVYAGLGMRSDYQFMVAIGMGTIAVILVSNVVQLFRAYALTRFAMNRVHAIGTRLTQSYLGRNYEYFLSRSTSDISKRILSETSEIANSFLLPAADLVSSALSAVFILGFLLFVDPSVTLIGLGLVLLLYGGVYSLSSRYARRLGQRRTLANRRRFAAISEAFGGIKDVKVTGMEDTFFRRFDTASKVVIRAGIFNKLVSELPRFFIQALFFSGVVCACLVLIDPAVFEAEGAGALTDIVPTLGAFAFAGQRLIPEMQRAYAAMTKVSFGAAALRNVYEEIDRGVRDRMPLPPADLTFSSDIAIDGVSYRYPGAERSGLDRVSARIRKGERIGIVGGTGAGKTTLVDVLLGLLPVSSGEIRIDGRSLGDAQTLAAWRRKVGYVPQAIFMLDGDFSDNIAFWEPEGRVDRDRVESAARAACIHEFIARQTPLGYRSRTGERGVMLSGGQRQRIGIARALYREAEFLVLDEASSALDSGTEREVMEAIAALPADLTVVMIAHRLSTVRGCDRIFVMEGGRLVEQGTWSELEAQDGHFSRLLQAAGE